MYLFLIILFTLYIVRGIKALKLWSLYKLDSFFIPTITQITNQNPTYSKKTINFKRMFKIYNCKKEKNIIPFRYK